MQICCLTILLATLFFARFLPNGNSSVLPSSFAKYRIFKKEIHLKHGKLHPHDDDPGKRDRDHLLYRYRWLGDDIVKTEADFEGEMDEEYPDGEKMVKLPGGCELTENQFLELESFKKETQYVKKCYCESGGVYCQINRTLFKHKIA